MFPKSDRLTMADLRTEHVALNVMHRVVARTVN